ncbi:ribosome maturation factor RimP [Candidatus Hakubella thermalkaliphila]|uniref:Ribosome maturation factor RimP n=1 Tax=Candidatus Hakubella thermalkaliphila TaxID=2754717 RepID=A0A6V8NHH1_9ACTN|nr:ribosome maturation factor RimP [Candidatus Hakubella thermalkaliphila]GFP19695.1 ribosome maturation factor RimP [Candidatus Hakubella thermalkaliphila]GFP29869.1 ribosome maturation factor RimP [Candidatus Hakubella thermalkaliphila]GFP39929.1 ribosome maturation factor RimP [Candidatus Hakubella thermalkaliphila]
MNIQEIRDKLEKLIREKVAAIGYELYDLSLNSRPSGLTLTVFIDREGGVTLEDCARVSQELDPLLDRADLIRRSYILEVSSPGAERALRSQEDFRKSTGKKVRIIADQDGKIKDVSGRVVEVGDGQITLLTDRGEELIFEYDQIKRANLQLEI